MKNYPISNWKTWFFQPKFQKERELLFFFLKLFAIWVSWKGIIWVLGEEKIPLDQRMFPALSAVWEAMNMAMVTFLLDLSRWILETLGYTSVVTGRSIWINQVHAIGVGNYCLGIQLMYYNTLLILITRASVKKKWIAIGFGIFITHFLNVIRISSMALIALYAPQWLAFAHDHVFNVMVFGTMIGFYYVYLVRTSQNPV